MNMLLFIIVPLLLAVLFVVANLNPEFSWIYGNSGNLISFMTAILTYYYVVLTGRMVRQMAETAENESRPYIVVDIEYDDGVTNFSMRNIGKTAAKNIKATVNPDVPLMNDKTLNNSVLGKPILLMPPGKEIKTFIGMFHQLVANNQAIVYEIQIEYEWNNKKIKEEHTLDLSFYRNLTFVVRKNVHHVAKSLDEIDKKLGKVIKWDAIHIKSPKDIEDEQARGL